MGPVSQGTMQLQVKKILGSNLTLNYSLKLVTEKMEMKKKIDFHFGYYFNT